MINICVLRKSSDYQERHVQWLARQVPDLVCLSDVDVAGVETIPLKYEWPKWWSKMELFRPDIDEDLMYYDLDTVVFNPVPDIPAKSMMLKDFYTDRSASGLMFIRNEDKAAVWDKWIYNPDTSYKPTQAHHGDQGFISDHLSHGLWQNEHSSIILSYKADIRKGRSYKDADIVCFHGQPRPWQCKESWIPPL